MKKKSENLVLMGFYGKPIKKDWPFILKIKDSARQQIEQESFSRKTHLKKYLNRLLCHYLSNEYN